jgi:hypothetical protein
LARTLPQGREANRPCDRSQELLHFALHSNTYLLFFTIVCRYFDDGNCVVNFSLAVKREYHPLERKARAIKYEYDIPHAAMQVKPNPIELLTKLLPTLPGMGKRRRTGGLWRFGDEKQNIVQKSFGAGCVWASAAHLQLIHGVITRVTRDESPRCATLPRSADLSRSSSKSHCNCHLS